VSFETLRATIALFQPKNLGFFYAPKNSNEHIDNLEYLVKPLDSLLAAVQEQL
jgi:hypothetical protein